MSRKWPLTGGIPSLLSEAVDHQVERVYMTGYQDGSVRIWDATYPALSLIFVLGTEVSYSSSVLTSKWFFIFQISTSDS